MRRSGRNSPGRTRLRNLVAQDIGQYGTNQPAKPECRPEPARIERSAQQPAHHALSRRALDLPINQVASDIDQRTVLHPRRTGGLAVAARQAAIQVRRSEEHTSELQSLMRTSYAVFCL